MSCLRRISDRRPPPPRPPPPPPRPPPPREMWPPPPPPKLGRPPPPPLNDFAPPPPGRLKSAWPRLPRLACPRLAKSFAFGPSLRSKALPPDGPLPPFGLPLPISGF